MSTRPSRENMMDSLSDVLELPDTKAMNAVDAARIQALCRTELTYDDPWCVLYCGAVQKIREALKDACQKSRFHYAEESFNW